MCCEFTRCLDWQDGIIRAFSWQLKCVRCAVALSNNLIYIYSQDPNIKQLNHCLQKHITDLTWHPVNEDVLAVGCQSVVLIWVNDPQEQSSRSYVCSHVIKTGIPTPVTSVAFSLNGEWLGICSPLSSRILLYKDLDNKNIQPIAKKIGRYWSGVTRLLWSPDNIRLLTLTTSNLIHVFENEAWSSKKFCEQMNEACQVACFSKPNGRILLFCSKNDTNIYSLFFDDKAKAYDVGGSNSFIHVLDVSEKVLDNGVKVGGRVHDIIWDQHGERLAISFKGSLYYDEFNLFFNLKNNHFSR